MPRSTLRVGGMLVLLMAPPASAQYYQLSATDDGKQLYFVSQQILQGKEADRTEYRLYRAGPDGVTLFAERGSLASEGSIGGSDGVQNPSVSGDGTLVALTFADVCLGGPDCVRSGNLAALRGSRSLDLGPGAVQISRNGKWAVVTSPPDEGTVPFWIVKNTLVDLTTGARQDVPAAAMATLGAFPSQVIASDGTVLAFLAAPVPGDPNTFTLTYGLWKQGTFTPLVLPPDFDPSGSTLSDDASTLVGLTYPPGRFATPSGIVALNLATGKPRTIWQSGTSTQWPAVMAVSNNGQRVLYRLENRVPNGYSDDGPAYVWDAVTGVALQVPLDDGELATDGTLSGSGEFAFVATTGSRIAKFALQTGAISSVFPAPPHCAYSGVLAGGSLARLHCSFTGSVAGLQGHLSYNGQDVPVLYANGSDIGVQIPWQFNGMFFFKLAIDVPSPSPFQAEQDTRVADGAPSMLPADPSYSSLFGIQIIKGDWSGYVTRQPLPGDIVHIYMTGLGDVVGDYPVTGVPASLTKLSPISWKLACRFQTDGPAIQPLFAGLAPGLLGVYQVTFGVPAGAGPVPITDLSCDLTAPGGMTVRFAPGTTPQAMCSQCYGIGIPLP